MRKIFIPEREREKKMDKDLKIIAKKGELKMGFYIFLINTRLLDRIKFSLFCSL